MKKLFCIVFILMCLVMFGCKKAVAEDVTQPVETPKLLSFAPSLEADVLYHPRMSQITAGLGFNFLSIYDVVNLRVEAIGATEGNFFGDSLVGIGAVVDIKNAIDLISQKVGSGHIKWLFGDYTPTIGYVGAYNFDKNPIYKSYESYILLNLFNYKW